MEKNRITEYSDLGDDMTDRDVRKVVIETKKTFTNMTTKEAMHEHIKEVIEFS